MRLKASPELYSFVHMQQVIIGLDTMEMISELDLSGPTEIDFGFEEIEDEDSDMDDDDDEDEDEADSDQEVSFSLSLVCI